MTETPGNDTPLKKMHPAQAEWQDKVRALEAQVAQIQAELDLIRPQKP